MNDFYQWSYCIICLLSTFIYSYLHNIYTAKENCDDQFSIAHLRAGDDGDNLLGPGEGRVVGGDVGTGQVGVVQQEHQVLARHLLFVLQTKKGKFIVASPNCYYLLLQYLR